MCKNMMTYWVLIMIILMFIIYWKRKQGKRENYVQYVIPRHREDVDWIKNFDLDYVIYNKGNKINVNSDKIKVIKLPNVGRDSHTLLYHIVTNYDYLPDITIFGANSTPPNHRYYKVKRTIELALKTQNTVFICNKNVSLHNDWNFTLDAHVAQYAENAKNSSSKLNPSSIRPFGKWYEHLWSTKEVTWVNYNIIFALHRDHIVQHPREYYKYLLSLHETEADEVVHYMERAMTTIFWPYPKSCVYFENL